MTMETMDGILVRDLVATCDRQNASYVPNALFGYIASVMDPREPSVYLVDLLPSLSTATQSFLNAMGVFNRSPLSEVEVANRRRRLLDCLDAFIDEARLSQQSVVFMDALRVVERV